MKALIMAAGYGTRLEPLTIAVPKPMVPIVNWPTMHHNIQLLKQHGFSQITANIHYHPEQIENYFGDGHWLGVNLAYSYEEKLLGTAGGVRRMAEEIAGVKETFLVLSSDALTDINLKRLVDFHKSKHALVTMALSRVGDPSHFGVVVCDEQRKIVEFQEKPPAASAKSDWVNTGIYVIEPQVLQLIPPGPYDFGKQLFPRLVAEQAAVYGYPMLEYWSDVGNLTQYVQSNYDAMQGRVRLQIPGKKQGKATWIGEREVVDRSARFEGTVVIGDRCRVGRDVYIKDAVIGDKCIIGDNAVITGSVIWSDTVVGAGCIVDRAVVGNWCHLETKARVEEGAVIANRSIVRQDRLVPARTSLPPNSIQ